MLCRGSDFQTILFAFDTPAVVSCELLQYPQALSGTRALVEVGGVPGTPPFERC